MKTRVVGYNYGFLPSKYFGGIGHGVGTTLNGSPIVNFSWAAEDNASFPALVVRDQYGWEDGCREREFRLLRGKVRVLGGHPGDPYYVGAWTLEADEVIEISSDQAYNIIEGKVQP